MHRLDGDQRHLPHAVSTAGDANHPNAAIDPENQFLWRMNPRRMEAEVVRDSVLYLAGQLDPTMGGPEIDETKGFESKRRSIYFRHSPDTQMEFLKMFDAPNPAECYMRSQSVVPQQALALANSQISQEEARVHCGKTRHRERAGRFRENSLRDNTRTSPVSGRTSGRRAISAAATGPAGVAQSIRAYAEQRARENFVHVLLNHNDFVTIR